MISAIEYTEYIGGHIPMKYCCFFDSDNITEEQIRYAIESGQPETVYSFTVNEYQYKVLKQLFKQIEESKNNDK